jgi:hypothetical protein
MGERKRGKKSERKIIKWNEKFSCWYITSAVAVAACMNFTSSGMRNEIILVDIFFSAVAAKKNFFFLHCWWKHRRW